MSWIVVLASVALVQCGGSTSPKNHIVVLVPADTVTAKVTRAGNSESVGFTVPFTIRNQSKVVLRIEAVSIEKGTVGTWLTVWSPIMAGPSTWDVGIDEIANSTLPVEAVLKGTGAPDWQSDSVPGDYRLLVRVRPADGTAGPSSFVSNSFALRESR